MTCENSCRFRTVLSVKFYRGSPSLFMEGEPVVICGQKIDQQADSIFCPTPEAGQTLCLVAQRKNNSHIYHEAAENVGR